MVTFKIEVGKTKRDGTHPIYIRICKDREFKRIRFFLDAGAKDVTANGEIKDTMLDLSINEAINSYKHKLLDVGAAAENWSAEEIVEYLTSQPKKKETVSKPEKKDTLLTQDQYEAMDIRLKTGAYRIIGTDKIITVKPGDNLTRICNHTLGPGMECYIEVYNNIKPDTPLEPGKKIKIPKVELKKKKKQAK